MATFKPMAPTLMLVKKLNIEHFFDDIYGIDKFGEHITKKDMLVDIISKYNLNKERTVMIGDAATDMIAAKQSGIKGIGVLWGYGSDKKPLIENSYKVINNIKEMDTIKL
jgi:phosphoglycolate phosphatase